MIEIQYYNSCVSLLLERRKSGSSSPFPAAPKYPDQNQTLALVSIEHASLVIDAEIHALLPLCIASHRNCLDADPNEHDDNIHALALTTVVLEGPHAVLLLVPKGPRGAVHAAPANMGFAMAGSCLGARGDVRLLVFGLGAAAGLAERGRGHQVLDDGAVAGEFVRGRGGALGGRLGDDGLQHGALQMD